MDLLINPAFSWKATLLYIALITLVVCLIGWLKLGNILPMNSNFNYTESEYELVKDWIFLAIAFGIILPGVTLLVFWKFPEIRTIWSFYFVVVFVQLLTEYVLSRLLFQTIVVMVGSLYSAFRVWQLWSNQQLLVITTDMSMVSHVLMISILWLMLIFWLSNIIVNFVIFRRKLL